MTHFTAFEIGVLCSQSLIHLIDVFSKLELLNIVSKYFNAFTVFALLPHKSFSDS